GTRRALAHLRHPEPGGGAPRSGPRTGPTTPTRTTLPRLHPTERLRRLRDAAYTGSRHGRTADDRDK
ncbi:hypothetical protein LV779_31140, partial [Streptomyces thinghirensis]|nr:hypothetical protein [Streptomyces thinghirensis]